MISGAEIMVRCLEAEGVKVVFGYPGATICPFYDKLYDSSIQHVLVRQEQNAAHAASGYSRCSGLPGVCVATSGPGATNLITGIATAYADSVPMIAITGQVRSDLLGRDVFQGRSISLPRDERVLFSSISPWIFRPTRSSGLSIRKVLI